MLQRETVMTLDEKHKSQLIEDVCQFIRIPSRSSPKGGEEGALQSLVAERMQQVHARVRTFEAGDVPGFREHPLCHGPNRDYRDRPTVIGELGPEHGPTLLILAHSDTVQINSPDDWTFDPFSGEVRDGVICGLGASDDKWGVASMLTIMTALQESGQTLRRKLIFASIIDEEHGVGNGTLLLTLAGIAADAALYLDGFAMDVFIGNLGGSNLYLRPRKELSSDHLSRHAALLESACDQLSKRRASLFVQPFYEDNVRKSKSVVLYRRSDDGGPFFLIPFYTLPGEERATVCRQLEDAVSAALGADLSYYRLNYREPWFEPGITSPATPLVSHISASVRDVLGREPHVATLPKQDRFVLTNHAGIPTVSFGPRSTYSEISGRGANHQPDECIPIDELWQGCQIAYSTVCRWLQEETP